MSFHSSIRVHLKVLKKITNKARKVIGVEIKALVEKNKIAPPFREANLPIYFGHGIDDAEAVFECLKDADVIEHKGAGKYTLEGYEDVVTKADWINYYDAHFGELVELVQKTVSSEDLI